MKIASISGSLRKHSANTALLRAAEGFFKAEHAEVEHCVIRDLPLFDEDVEASRSPLAVKQIRRQVEAVDVVLIGTPEYNGSISGALKNALDWLSLPDGAGELIGKSVASKSSSPSNYGAAWAQENLRFVLKQCQAILINEELVTVSKVFDSLDSHGELVSPPDLSKVHSLCVSVHGHKRAETRHTPARLGHRGGAL